LSVNDKLNWTEAVSNCDNKYSSILVTIGDRFEQYWINEQFLKDGETRWTGLKYNKTSQKYIWTNTKETVTFDHWDRNNPGNYKKNVLVYSSIFA
jgi:hypothetical protein